MEKIFDIKNKGFSNDPTDEEISFITSYIEKEFSVTEKIDLTKKKDEEIKTAFDIIISIKNAIADLLSPDGGNYHKLLTALNTGVDFENRLAGIIGKFSNYIPGEKKAAASPITHRPGHGYKTYELNEYLDQLLLITPLTDEDIKTQLQVNTTQLQTLGLLSDYILHLTAKYAGSSSLVFFLRDTLLLYLGAKRLQNKGVSIDARAILINRKLIQSFTPGDHNPIYKKSYNLVFRTLNVCSGKFSREFTEQYKELFTADMTASEIHLLKFLDTYIKETVSNNNNFIAVDTAAHGTMPLLTHVATGSLKSLEMFTSTPWLYEFYCSNIFRNNFPDMRALESFVCQEELFQFAYISAGKIYVNVTCDPIILSKAKMEIGIFLNIAEKRFPLT